MRPSPAGTALYGGALVLLATGTVLGGALAGSHALFGSDYMTLNYPILAWAQRAWREAGELPLWLPHLFGGMPLLGSMNSGLLYPTELAACLTNLPPHRFYAWNAWLHEGIAGAGAAWMLAREGFARGPALWGGVCYALGGLVFTQLGVADTFTHRAVAWLPWLVGGIRGAIRNGIGSSRRDLLLAGGVLGLLWLTCAIQMIVFGACFLLVLQACERPAHAGRSAAVYAIVGAIGCLLGAALLLPAFDYYRFSDRPEATEAFANLWACRPSRLLGFFVPGLWGRTAVGAVYYGPHESDNTTAYAGLLPLAWAAWGIVTGWRRRLPWLVAGTCAFVLAFGSQTPLGHLMQQAPVIGSFRGWTRWLLAANLALAVFAAEGWVAFLDRRRTWIAPVLLGGIALAAVTAWVFRPAVTDVLLRTSWASERIASGDVKRAEAEATVRRALARAAIVAPASLAVASVACWPGVSVAATGVLVGAWTAVDLVHAARPFLELGPASRRAVFDPVGEFLDAQDGLFRVASEEPEPQKNLRIGRDVHYVWGYHGVPPRALYRFGAALRRTSYPRGLLAILNVRYYVQKDPLVAGDMRLIGGMRGPDGRLVYVHEFRDPLPRLFFPAGTRVAAGEDAALEAMLEPAWDWRTAVVFGRGAREARYAPASASPLILTPNERRAVVTARGPALAVLSTVWYPGWIAFVDGVRVPVVRTDVLLMGAEVPAGRHELRFRRDPRPFRIGLWLTCLAAAGLAVLGVSGSRGSGPGGGSTMTGDGRDS